MALAVFIVLHGSSLHCAAATAGFYSQKLMGWKYKAPTWKTISNWVERCGLHALNLIRELSGEYVGIGDITLQIGKEQLFLLLGIRTELTTTLERPLTVADVTILGMEVQSSWTGADIAEFIQRPTRLAYDFTSPISRISSPPIAINEYYLLPRIWYSWISDCMQKLLIPICIYTSV